MSTEQTCMCASLILEGSGIGIENDEMVSCIIIKLRVPTGRVEIKDFLELVTLARWPFLIDGESWPAWKCAFLLLFTDSRRLDTSRRDTAIWERLFVFWSDSKIGISRAFSQSPDGKTPFVNPWILNVEFFILSSHWCFVAFTFVYRRLENLEKSGRVELGEILDFRRFIIDL